MTQLPINKNHLTSEPLSQQESLQENTPQKSPFLDSMIRVNQAGEQGALDIYRGQLSVFKDTPHEAIIQEMYDQEHVHKQLFDQLMQERQVRPTFLSPLWRMAGYGLGKVTALLGKESAMVCTEAVEEVICDHYQQQLEYLEEKDPDLHKTIQHCYQDEKMHQEMAIQHGSRQAFGYNVLKGAIKTATKLAIFLSKRI
jgi:ubiquinone biosynthesis monooxygenase Coq7